MKRLFNYIPSISITFTLVILFSSTINLINGYTAVQNIGILAIFIMILAIHLVTFAFSYIDFKTYKAYYINNFFSTYLSFLLLSYIFDFFPFTASNIISNSSVFCIIYYLGYLYNKRKAKLEADKINKKISNS